ncbi:P pilus assembly protein, pilin FimA [Proteus vulgaris]|uniref:fimbrial protein n=1 Tax=Proteus vulgaris TaxID=585 RepID=UPI000DFD7DF8|nr:fimbrial protein [Proteus vulgaris]SUC19502.1 P pilus assembly protein, pilin FimA [Proteus vulgaris]
MKIIDMFSLRWAAGLMIFPLVAFAGSNSVTVQFEASLYSRTCKVNVPSLIEYGPVQANAILQSDAGSTESLKRDIVLTLTECSGPGNLANSHVIVSGPTVAVNGHPLFKESGSADGVGIKLLSGGVAKTDGEAVWLLNNLSDDNDTHTLTAALSCGDCTDVNAITVGDLRATMTFTVLTD